MGSRRVGHLLSDFTFTFMHWRRKWQPTPVFLPGESQGRRSLVGCHLWGCTESDTTEWLHFHFSFPYTEEGNGNPLQCSCLENPRDGGAWWAAICGVAHIRTRLNDLAAAAAGTIIIYRVEKWTSKNNFPSKFIVETDPSKLIFQRKERFICHNINPSS